MELDPNVQVAIVSVFTAFITTAGVIVVAIINNRKERDKAASAGVDAALDERDILERMLSLIAESDRKEAALVKTKAALEASEAENASLKTENAQLKTENAQLKVENATLKGGGSDDAPAV